MKIIGVMSGSSLDGLDISFCTFQPDNKEKILYTIEAAHTYPFHSSIQTQLENIQAHSAEEFTKLDTDLGIFIGQKITEFIKEKKLPLPDLIASHGHTAFHNPVSGYSKQIGNGAQIAAITNIPAVTDFRSMDVALGGQGAPLVPVGDKYLFAGYEFCLNLGGYGNISYDSGNKRIAFDICPVNKAINYIVSQEGLNMDKNGEMARKGKIIPPLYKELNHLEFYSKTGPKSLDDHWLKNRFIPVVDQYKEKYLPDVLRTLYDHIALQIHLITGDFQKGKVLVTGGGAFNTFLTERIKESTHHDIVLPSKLIIEFKEALIFAFLGYLKMQHQVNCLASVTGAQKNSIGGVLYEI